MKKIMNVWLMATLVCGLSLSVTSCKDDDDDNNAGGELETEEQAAKASKFWSVVGQLVSSDSYTADYADKTFEPTYGMPESDGSLTRIVETNDMQTAARRFADLVGASIDENTPTYTWSDPEVGTLTYTRGGSANEWATVDVSIKQVPRLRKIIYRQGGEGTNGDFAGKAYYRFGDVVSRTLANGKVEYWICVRPAFGPEKKGDSHWVCLNYLPAKNIFNYAYQSKSWTVPTGIGKDKENMQNLAEMLYAMCNPKEWENNANTLHTDGKLWGFSGLPIFADFSKANVMYHNQYFWQKVADGWEKNKIAERAMNIEMGVLYDMMYRGHQGLHLLYEGYSWWTKTSWNCTLYEASYTNGQKNEEKNLHHAEYKEVKKRMEDIKFDCTLMGAATDNYMEFFDNDLKYRWVVRHATGADLNGGSDPSPTAPLQGAGVKTVYRYYDEYEDEWLRKGPNGKSGYPEVAVADKNDPATWNTSEYTGMPHYRYFNFYKDQDGNRWFPVKCAGGEFSDNAPFTYFISFEGLKASADGRRITNLPNRDMAMKMMTWLFMGMTNFSITTDDALNEDNGLFNPRFDYKNMVLTAGVHPHHLWKAIIPEGVRIEAKVLVAAVGYTDDDNSTGQQKLIRWIDFPDDYVGTGGTLQRMPRMYFWTSYPKFQTADKFFPTVFTGDPIYLQDAASAASIALHAEEPYVYSPLVKNFYSNVADAAVLSPRKEPIEAAKLATNYIYNQNSWGQYQIPLDIWREPVLLFRVTRLYDRGDDEYATRSENGISLTPLLTFPDYDEETEINGMAEVYRQKIDQCHKAVIDFKYSIDGKDQKPKTYREDVIR